VEARVVRISVAPVKALGLVHPEAVHVTRDGIAGDRRFWLRDADGRLFNNKRNGPLMTVRPEWDETTRVLALTFPDGTRLEGDVEPGAPVEAEMYGKPHPSRLVPGPWQEALSETAGEPLTLLWSDGHATDRRGDGDVTLVSRGSLERLREESGTDHAVDGRRFRMTFELDGVLPHEEDTWIGHRVRVGEAQVLVNGDVGRCVTTTRDPDNGVSDFPTLDVLARYRRDGRTEPLPFGVFGAVEREGRVAIGDVVRPVVERS
jgi:uncharacterized protein YcbX